MLMPSQRSMQKRNKKIEVEMLKKSMMQKEYGLTEIHAIVETGDPPTVDWYCFSNTRKCGFDRDQGYRKGAIQQALVGSTASFVVAHASCSVLVVK